MIDPSRLMAACRLGAILVALALPAHAASFAYVANYWDNSVSVVDTGCHRTADPACIAIRLGSERMVA